jgi:hypothetical protein
MVAHVAAVTGPVRRHDHDGRISPGVIPRVIAATVVATVAITNADAGGIAAIA